MRMNGAGDSAANALGRCLINAHDPLLVTWAPIAPSEFAPVQPARSRKSRLTGYATVEIVGGERSLKRHHSLAQKQTLHNSDGMHIY
jgi:hypothetical protein